MVDEPQRPEEVAEQPTGWVAHDWYSYDNYLNVHYSFLEKLSRDGSVVASHLSFYEYENAGELSSVNLRGAILCAESVALHVNKLLDVRRNRRNQIEVKGSYYVYHARLRGQRLNLFRYCSAHGLDQLHCHRFDLKSGLETGRPNIALHELPPLNEVILEAIETAKLARASTR
jgi:hypothetical protein